MTKEEVSPTVHILMDVNHRLYLFRPGERISGTIQLRGADEPSLQVAQVSVGLSGRSKTKITVSRGQSNSQYRDRRNLFAMWVTVFDETQPKASAPSGAAEDSNRSFPFSMVIPTETSDKSRIYDKAARIGFVDDVHPLPPSVQRANFGALFSPKRGYGEIEYALDARVTVSRGNDRQASRNYVGQLVLKLTPAGQSPVPNELDMIDGGEEQAPPPYARTRTTRRNYVVSSTLLLPHVNRKLSFQEKMLDRLSSKVPTAKLAILIGLPDTLTVDQHITGAFLSLDFNREESTCPEVPDVVLTSVRVDLECKTELRAPSTFGIVQCRDSSTISLCYRDGLSLVLPVEGQVDIGSLLRLKLGQLSYAPRVPSFASYSIQRFYHWRFKANIRCGGKTLTPSFDGPVTVLPPTS